MVGLSLSLPLNSEYPSIRDFRSSIPAYHFSSDSNRPLRSHVSVVATSLRDGNFFTFSKVSVWLIKNFRNEFAFCIFRLPCDHVAPSPTNGAKCQVVSSFQFANRLKKRTLPELLVLKSKESNKSAGLRIRHSYFSDCNNDSSDLRSKPTR